MTPPLPTFGPKRKISSYKTCSSYKRRRIHQDSALDTDDAASCNGRVEMSLLERLRRNLVVVVCETEEEQSQKMKLILEHRLEFPLKLRANILAAAALQEDGRPTATPQDFLSNVFQAAKVFLLGRHIRKKFLLGRYIRKKPKNKRCHCKFSEWHGLDRSVDTEDEVELTIRFFPSLFFQTLETAPLDEWIVPEMMLFSSEKAVAFVPLFLELGYEFGELPSTPFYHSLFKFLLVPNRRTFMENTQIGNRCAAALIGKMASAELQKECLLVFARLRKMGWLQEDGATKLISWLMSQEKGLGKPFIQTRLRFLIDGNPSLLQRYKGGRSLLLFYLQNKRGCPLWMFELVLELGLSHFPTDFGFLFPTFDWNYQAPAFQLACQQYGGTERVKDIIHGVIGRLIRQGSTTLQSLVITVASNLRWIGLGGPCTISAPSIDGLHAFVRFDPIGLVAPSCPRTSTNNKVTDDILS